MCVRGARKFFADHNLNWQLFLKQGIDTSEIEHINDAMMTKVVKVAEAANGR